MNFEHEFIVFLGAFYSTGEVLTAESDGFPKLNLFTYGLGVLVAKDVDGVPDFVLFF